MVTATSSLRQHALEKCPHKFDTLIVDDASLVTESDCLAAMRHGAIRLILLGNRLMEPQMFLLKTTTSNKTLYHRIPDSQLLVIEPPAPEAASPSKAKGKKAKPVVQKPKIDYIFVDVAEGKEAAKKESYENYGEANAVVDYLKAYHGSLDLSTHARCCCCFTTELSESLCAWLRECLKQVEAEVVSNSRNKLHQTWEALFWRPL